MPERFTLAIKPKHFSKKLLTANQEADALMEKNHMVYFPRCNFECPFCSHDKRVNSDESSDTQNSTPVHSYSLEDFELMVKILMLSGKSFEFTGGEITLVKNLNKLLEVVKQKGGEVYLDTNGSNPSKVIELVRNGLVDALGVSIKGLNKEEAALTAGVRNKKLSWDNPLTTIRESIRAKADLKILVTMVVDNGVTDKRLDDFANLLSGLDTELRQIILKINNFIATKYTSHLFTAMDVDKLLAMVRSLVQRRPEWEDRTILIPRKEAVSEIEPIIRL